VVSRREAEKSSGIAVGVAVGAHGELEQPSSTLGCNSALE